MNWHLKFNINHKQIIDMLCEQFILFNINNINIGTLLGNIYFSNVLYYLSVIVLFWKMY